MTTREEATFILLGLLLLWVLPRRSIRSSFLTALKSLLAPKILTALLTFIVLLASATLLAQRLNLWSGHLLAGTVLWFLFTGFRYLLSVTDVWREPHFFRSKLLELVGAAAFFEFFFNIESFSLPVELALQFGLSMLAMTQVVAAADAQYEQVTKLLATVSFLVTVWLLGHTVVHIAHNSRTLDLREMVSTLLMPLWLTCSTLGFLYALSLIAGYEVLFVLMSFGRSAPLRARLGVMSVLHGRPRHVAGFVAPYVWQAAEDGTFGGSRRAAQRYLADKRP